MRDIVSAFVYMSVYVCVCKCVYLNVTSCFRVTFRDGTSSFKVWSTLIAPSLLNPPPRVRYSLRVAFHVQRQVVRSGKAPVAVAALERFRARVLSVVARQLVAAGKAPLAALPRALVGFFACDLGTSVPTVLSCTVPSERFDIRTVMPVIV